MKLSVITTVYNASEYLKESLDSLFGQSFKDFEVIFVNDGSTDGSKDILLQYFHDHDNVNFLENTNNEGIPVSRNRALLASVGEYIAIHDGDDISLPDRFSREVCYLDSHPEIDIVGSHAYKVDYVGTLLGYMSYPPKTTEESFALIKKYKLSPVIDPSSMFRKNAAISIGGYSMDPLVRTALDFHLWCRMLSNGSKLHNIQEPLIKYRINPHGVTRTENNKMVEATDVIVAAFIKKNFEKLSLRKSLFEQDCFRKIQKN